MTAEQKAAFIVAQTQMMVSERHMMMVENDERINQGLSPAYGSDEWQDWYQNWERVLGHNSLVDFFKPSTT